MDVRRPVTRAARTRTMTSFPAMDHAAEMRALRLAASAGVQPSRTQSECARTVGETISIVAAEQRHVV